MIVDQFKELGFSCDWDRLAYTLDPKLFRRKLEKFLELYTKA